MSEPIISSNFGGPSLPASTFWENHAREVSGRHTALLDALAALEQQMREPRPSHNLLFWADKVKALREKHGGTK